MALSEPLVERFQALWLKKYDESLDPDESRQKLEDLVELVRLTSRPK